MSLFDDKITKNVADAAAKILESNFIKQPDNTPKQEPLVESKPDVLVEEKRGKLFSIITEKLENKGIKKDSEKLTHEIMEKLHKESFSDLISTYKKKGFKGLSESIAEEVDNETFTKEVKDQQENSEGKKKKKIADAAVQGVEIQKEESDEELTEKELTPNEEAKKEKIVMAMKKKLPDFRKKYGDRAKEVLYATATKNAKESD
jgi:flavodoxin